MDKVLHDAFPRIKPVHSINCQNSAKDIKTHQLTSGQCAGQIYKHLLGSAKVNGREDVSCLGQVFNFKLGRFVMSVIA
jgi:hypothetical protein